MRHFDLSNVEWFKQNPMNEPVNNLLSYFCQAFTPSLSGI